MRSFFLRRSATIILALWVMVSIASVAAMYHLWFEREFAIYFGKTASSKQEQIFILSGLPLKSLSIAKDIDLCWPIDAEYKFDGSGVMSSYMKYLVIPRIPSGSEYYKISEEKNKYHAQPSLDECVNSEQVAQFSTVKPTPSGLFFSLLIIILVSAGLRHGWKKLKFSIPESMAVAIFGIYLLVVLSKGVFGSMQWAGWAAVGASLVSLGYIAKTRVQSGPVSFGLYRSKLSWESAILILLILFFCLWSFLMAVIVGPDDWDAWAQWGPKAKILAMEYASLASVRYFVPGSGDYPLLWPALWAFSGWAAGGWEDQWSKGWGPILLVLTSWQLGLIAFRASGRAAYGLLVAALWVSMPAVPLVASWAYAEAPLWLMMVCAMSRLLNWQVSKNPVDISVAGFFVAAAACTKNEGVLFAFIVCIWTLMQSRSVREAFAPLAALCIPLALFWGPWMLYTRLVMETSNHALWFLGSGWVPAFSDFGSAVLQVFTIWKDIRQWNLVLPVLMLASMVLIFRGDRASRINLLIPFAMLFSSFIIALFHGPNWSWQIGVAWNRLTMQSLILLLPVLVYGFSRCSQKDCKA
jgi:hypothetical protein